MRQLERLLFFVLTLYTGSGVRFSVRDDFLRIYSEVEPFLEDTSQRRFLGLPGFDLGECVWASNECPNSNITFWLYTRGSEGYPWELSVSDPVENLYQAPYKKGKKWKLIIHGYTGSRDYDPNPQLRPALLEYGDFNIISVDYGPIVKEPCYIAAVSNVPVVANCTAQLLDKLHENGILKMDDLHVLAFSLGGQVAGNLRNYLRAGVVPRISAMDPALPLFLTASNEMKLDSSDAKFVDVIHTNAGLKGQPISVGHVDFYPNGGYTQFGCQQSNTTSLSSCNHQRAVLYYAESISTTTGFWAVPCNSIITYLWGWCPANETNQILMGYHMPRSARGNYYLSTHDHTPFAMGRGES